jgi:predicted  nucleic acid-binding Zn-ribbon protein
LKQHEFQSLSEKVEVLHEGIYRIHRRIERQVKKLRRLGAQWRATQGEADRENIERREKVVFKVLARLNSDCEARDKKVIPKERHLYRLEKDVANLKKIVGEVPFMND